MYRQIKKAVLTKAPIKYQRLLKMFVFVEEYGIEVFNSLTDDEMDFLFGPVIVSKDDG